MTRHTRSLTWAVLAVLWLWSQAAAAQPGGATARADACLDKAGEMTGQGKLMEAADNYVCAADELAKVPGQEKRAARFRATASFYRSRATYTQRGVTGTMGRANLDEALRQIALALTLLPEGSYPVDQQMMSGWQSYLLGIKSGFDNQFGESRTQFERARTAFMEVGNKVPPLRDLMQSLIELAEDQTISASMMDLMSNHEEYGKRGGEVNQRLAELKERVSPSLRPYYDAQEHLFHAVRLFDDAGDRLEAWDHQAAALRLGEAKAALGGAARGVPSLPSEMRRTQFAATIDGWTEAVEAEAHHARALNALLDLGDTGKARAELIDGANGYHRALAAFEKAGLGRGATASVLSSSARLNERAKVVASAFGPTQAMLGVGRVFVLIFFVSLTLMTWFKSKLRLDAKFAVTIALVVAIVGAFGLRAPDILNAIKPFTVSGGAQSK